MIKSTKFIILFIVGVCTYIPISANAFTKFFKKDIPKAFGKGQHLDRIIVRNESGDALDCEFIWKDRNAAHGTLPVRRSILSSHTTEIKAPLLGYRIYSIQAHTINFPVKIHAHENTYFVIRNRFDLPYEAYTIDAYQDEYAYKKAMVSQAQEELSLAATKLIQAQEMYKNLKQEYQEAQILVENCKSELKSTQDKVQDAQVILEADKNNTEKILAYALAIKNKTIAENKLQDSTKKCTSLESQVQDIQKKIDQSVKDVASAKQKLEKSQAILKS